MLISLFDYHLPKELIAQQPLKDRIRSRLLVLSRSTGKLQHKHFYQLPEFLRPGDVLVLNDTKVISTRLIGKRQTSGYVDILLVERVNTTDWLILIKARGRIRPGEQLFFNNGLIRGQLLNRTAGQWLIRFDQDVQPLLSLLGKAPLPPYIKRRKINDEFIKNDLMRYQTVYARKQGAIAAPTAGLHFTKTLLTKFKRQGVKIVFVTLHVGIGTFKPVDAENVEDHIMVKEYFEVLMETLKTITNAKREGRRIIAVGTTVCRVLETMADSLKRSCQTAISRGWTDLFIRPGYQFKIINGLITNFHLPRGTPLLLVSALAGREKILEAYNIAIQNGYRFYSYGDAMLILP